MELPPTSTFGQATAYFTGFSEDEQKQQILDLQPVSFPNKFIESLDITQGISVSSLENEFREADFTEAYRLYNGALQYPFQSIADITNHQFDPSYFDGSEGVTSNFNVQENLIGTPLGVNELVDPRVTYIDSLMKLKEYTAGNIPLDDSYIKNLYMLNTQKGANYYSNQLEDLKEALGSYSRQAELKNKTQLSDFYFEHKVQRGVHEHPAKIVEGPIKKYSTTPQVQYNYRREDMENPYYIPKNNRATITKIPTSTNTYTKKDGSTYAAPPPTEKEEATSPPIYATPPPTYAAPPPPVSMIKEDEKQKSSSLTLYEKAEKGVVEGVKKTNKYFEPYFRSEHEKADKVVKKVSQGLRKGVTEVAKYAAAYTIANAIGDYFFGGPVYPKELRKLSKKRTRSEV